VEIIMGVFGLLILSYFNYLIPREFVFLCYSHELCVTECHTNYGMFNFIFYGHLTTLL
jgi:hypothetical protein